MRRKDQAGSGIPSDGDGVSPHSPRRVLQLLWFGSFQGRAEASEGSADKWWVEDFGTPPRILDPGSLPSDPSQ